MGVVGIVVANLRIEQAGSVVGRRCESMVIV
jgi:hypothetical protein